MYLKNLLLTISFSVLGVFGLVTPTFAIGSFFNQTAFDSSIPTLSGDQYHVNAFKWYNNGPTSTLTSFSLPVYNFINTTSTNLISFNIYEGTNCNYNATDSRTYFRNGVSINLPLYQGYSEYEFRPLSGVTPLVLKPGLTYCFITVKSEWLSAPTSTNFLNIHDLTRSNAPSGYLSNYFMKTSGGSWVDDTSWVGHPAFALYDNATGVFYSNALFSQTYREPQCADVVDSFEKALCYMFVPDSNVIGQFEDFKSRMEKKPPFGYFTVYKDVINFSFSSTTTSTSGDYSILASFDGGFFTVIKDLIALGFGVITGLFLFQRIRFFNFHE